MATIQLNQVEKWYESLQVIKGVSLSINTGEFIVFVGPSGCGKSTLLRMIAGLEDTNRGQILINSQDVTDQPPSQRGLAMVFQSYALYPHMTVRENMGFSLKTAGSSKIEMTEKVNKVASVLRLEPYLERKPKHLSGGQRQRVAIGRSIVRSPLAFLFDEPLSNLDAALRVEMRYEIAKLHQTLKSTMIYVTHDQVEAMTLADRIVVLQGGRIEQIGTPKELYEKPNNLFVAQFIGSPQMNIIPLQEKSSQFANSLHLKDIFSKASYLGVRPESIEVVSANEGDCTGIIDLVEYLGADSFILVNCEVLGKINIRVKGQSQYPLDSKVGLKFDNSQIHFFDSKGGRIVA